ncbi:FimV/HubP family polar landmark protein [Melaminivora suipulveris]|uniref:FimV/HubP family polar landmark protein n=1 Tax=Melaminivora suipulveris TaxID=2109913 RepID=UPI0018F8A89A|nr:FimV/HubP family polar landmark protein [Melaminivora suipulveris]
MHRWNFSILATAALLSVGLHATDANALALGRLNVQSALGEPLRAEIDLPQITPAEAESLRVAPASPEVFRAQGAEYSSAAHSVQVQIQRRPDGSMYLRLSSPRPINDPFVDLVVDANWSSGHIVRSYTLLLDPPALRRPPAAAVAAAPQLPPPAARATPPAAEAPTRVEAPARARAPASAPPAPAAAAPASTSGGDVTVRPGDTAGRIAAAHRPAGASLDQMLVAMMRGNPDAFIQGNVNRLRAGAVLQMPDATQAQATPAAEARRIVAAQSRDFNEFRRRLAGAAPASATGAADRSASGSVQAQVQDSQASAAAPDRLTLSKGSVSAGRADDQLARGKQANQDAERMAELSRNISELNQLSNSSAAKAGAGAPAAPAAPAASSAGGLAVPAPDAVPPAAPAAEPAASTPAEAPAAAAPALADAPQAAASGAEAPAPAVDGPAAAPAPRPAPAAPLDIEEPSFLASLADDPLLAGAALALLLALIGYGGWRVAQRRRAETAVDSSFMDSRKGPDSFFGASGGQRVDTASSALSTGASSSMAYSPSQLDAGDVDPVAEADVYLAYGRDLQAEEILKEAQRHQPERVSIPVKLAEIHAKRQDRRALEVAAGDVLRLTGGKGPDWFRVAELGRTLDPTNSLYQPGAAATAAGVGAAGAAAIAAAAVPLADAASEAPAAPESELPNLDLDLDFDLDLHEAPPAPPAAASPFTAAAAAQTQMQEAVAAARDAAPPTADMDLDLGDLELPEGSWEASRPPAETADPALDAAPVATEPSPLDLDDIGLTFADSSPAPLVDSGAPASGSAPLEFDLGDLSLDLGAPSEPAPLDQATTLASELLNTAPAPVSGQAIPDDPMATKLALAEEFQAIGDSEGARALVEEVLAESTGELRTRAQRLLAQLG